MPKRVFFAGNPAKARRWHLATVVSDLAGVANKRSMLVSPGTPGQIPDLDWITRWVGRFRVGDQSTGTAVTDEKGGKSLSLHILDTRDGRF